MEKACAAIDGVHGTMMSAENEALQRDGDQGPPVAPAPHIAALRDYEVASQDVWRSDARDTLKLDWNESTRASRTARRAVLTFMRRPGAFNWYPDVGATELTTALSEHLRCSPLELLVFGGCDVALETLARTYLTSADEVAIVVPSYDNFRVYAQSTGARSHEIRASDEGTYFDAAYVLDQIKHLRSSLKMLYLISPNNPIGYVIPTAALKTILDSAPNMLVVVDESYVEFAGAEQSALQLIRSHENLVVARSFSKAYGLAGLRVGYLLSSHRNLRHVRKLRNGKNVSMFAQVAAVAVLRQPDEAQEHIRLVCEARDWFSSALVKEGAFVYPSQANFVLLGAPDPPQLVLELYRRRINTRDRSRLPGTLVPSVRITIGYRDEMERVFQALLEIPRSLWILTREVACTEGSIEAPRSEQDKVGSESLLTGTSK